MKTTRSKPPVMALQWLVIPAVGLCFFGMPGSAQDVWRLEDRPTVSIGDPIGSFPGDLYRVTATGMLSDGRIIVADGAQRILVFDDGGSHVATIGNEGQGPGEFQMLSRLQVLPGDSILSWDWNQFRVTVFDAAGEVAVTANMLGAPPPEVIGRFGDGSLLALIRNVPLSPSGYFEYSSTLLRLDQRGQLLNTVATVPGGEGLDGGRRGLRILGNGTFFRETKIAIGASEVFVATGSAFEVTAFSSDGVSSRTFSGPDRSSSASDDVLREIFPERATLLEEMIPSGRDLPEVSRLLVDDVGNVWVQRWRHLREGPDQGGEWSVFNPAGVLIAAVGTPDRFRVDQVWEGRVVGVWRDELDREFVRVYRLDWD